MEDENGEKSPSLTDRDDGHGEEDAPDTSSHVSTKSTRYSKLKSRKKSSKTRLTKTRNQLVLMTTGDPGSKTEIRRAMRKIKAEAEIIEKIINALKETIVLSDEPLEGTDVDIVIENLDKELSEILGLVDASINEADRHINERILNGEDESETTTIRSRTVSEKSLVEVRQQEAEDTKKRLEELEEEQRALQQELSKKSEAFELNEQRIKDARSFHRLSEARLKASKQMKRQVAEDVPVLPLSDVKKVTEAVTSSDPTRVKLKGVDLPTFSGLECSIYVRGRRDKHTGERKDACKIACVEKHWKP